MGVFFPVIFHILRFFMYVLTYKNSFANKINFIPCKVEQISTLKKNPAGNISHQVYVIDHEISKWFTPINTYIYIDITILFTTD